VRSRRRKSVACNYGPDESAAPSSVDWLHYIAAANISAFPNQTFISPQCIAAAADTVLLYKTSVT